MHIQNQIKRTLCEPSNIEYIRHLLTSEEVPHRTDLATRACEQFGFHDTRGQAQIGGCLKALRDLACAGPFVLLARRVQPRPSSHRRVLLLYTLHAADD